MKKIFILIAIIGTLAAVSACHDDNQTTWDEYADWRELNNEWLKEMQHRLDENGNPYYRTIIPAWNPGTFVLIHYFNDRKETEGNLSPLYTSVVDVRYRGYNCRGIGFDSSDLVNRYGKLGIQRFSCNGTIQGWGIALQDMRVGDTAEIIVPYGAAYGAANNGTILPYSNLRFNLRLEDIYKYEASPY